MGTSSTEQLLKLASADPSAAKTQATRALQRTVNDAERAGLLHALGLAERNLENPVESVNTLRQAVELAPKHTDLLVGIRTTLAVSLMIIGQPEQGLAQLDVAQLDATGLAEARIAHQRAGILQRIGETRQALSYYRSALAVFQLEGESTWEGHVHNNLSILHCWSGELDEALAASSAAETAYVAAGEDSWVAAALYNRSWIIGCGGDLPTALGLSDQAQARLEHLGIPQASLLVARAEILLRAGLFSAARSVLSTAIDDLAARELRFDLNEAIALAAQAAELDGDLKAASLLADRAFVEILDQDASSWSAVAAATSFGILCRTRPGRVDLGEGLRRLVGALESAGQGSRVASVYASGALAALSCDDLSGAERCLGMLPTEIGNPGDTATAAAIRAQLAVARGNPTQALKVLDASYLELSADIEVFGAIDAAAQASASVVRLIEQAKMLTAPTDMTHEFVTWTDRGRQIATWQWPRLRDPELQILLNQARAAIADTHSEDPEEARQANAEVMRLKAEIRSSRWTQSAERTGRMGTSLDSSIARGLHLDLTQVDGSWYLAQSGNQSGHWSIDMDDDEIAALTRLGRLMHTAPESSRRDIWARVEQAMSSLDKLISSALGSPAQPVTIGIDEKLSGVPWSALPSLWDRAYSILPTRKLVGRTRQFTTDRDDTISLLGPGLVESAEQSVHSPRPPPVSAETIEQVWEALEHRVVQISAHGGPEPENPLFGWLDLGCGDVLLHDLMFLDKVPEIVILAACFAARTESMGPGGTVSFADGFLALGTRWVVAASGTLSDSQDLQKFSDTVLDLVAAGQGGPVALANARQMSGPRGQSLAALTFTCFGG